MKKLLLFITILISSMGLFAQNVGDNTIIDYEGYSLKFTVTSVEPAECEVVCETKPTTSIGITIPPSATIEGMEFSVTSIGSYAFSDCTFLTSIEIPNSVTSIGNYAFSGCTFLTSIEIPNSVTSIGNYAFYGCYNLTSIEIPNSVTSIGEWAFSYCYNLTSITVEEGNPVYDSRNNCNAIIETETNTLIAGCQNTIIPNSVTSIGEEAFFYCENLTSIEIPNSVTYIGYEAFYSCSNLTSIEIPNSVTYIGNDTFSGCDNLTSITVEEGNPVYDSRNNSNAIIETETNTLIAGCQNTIIPNSVTIIGDYAFYSCSNLTSIEIPNSVTSIGNYAFSYCYNLTSIEIPNSVTYIGSYAFYYCTSLTSIEIPNSVTSIGDYVFSGCSNLTSIEIPNSVTSIGEGAFSYCDNLTSITVEEGNTVYDSRNDCNAIIETESNTLIAGCQNTIIPNSVTSIGNSAFSSCYNLTSIEIPNSVTSIGNDAFSGCTSLTSIEIPNSVTSIGNSAFYSCTSLTSIEIPNSVISIGYDAFYWCTSLTSVYCYAENVPETSEYAFDNCPSDMVIYVPAQSLDAYKAAYHWNEYTIMAMEVQPTPSNKRHCLLSITQTNENENITYVYEEGTNKVVRIDKGVDNGYGEQYRTFLNYDANGLLISTEYGFADANSIDKESTTGEWDVVEYTYTDGKLTSYTVKEFENWTLYQEPCYIKACTLTYEGDNVVELISTYTYWGYDFNTDSYKFVEGNPIKTTYSYEDGKLVGEEHFYYDQWAITPGFITDYTVIYAYDATGNCVSATKTQWGNTEVTSYIYDETKLAADVYCFVYPHEVKPVSTNIISKAETYRLETDFVYNEETGSWVELGEQLKVITAEAAYNYTFDVNIYPTEIEFGEVRLGNYWTKEETVVSVEIDPLGKTITSITCDNAFFTVPVDIDLPANYIMFELGYDKTYAAGEYTGNIIVTLEDGTTVTVPVTATAYTPVTPDVFELAQEITFTEDVYTDTPNFATLHDDYLMLEENEFNDGNLLDAVYAFTLDKESVVNVNVTGENAQYAIYKAEGFKAPYEGNVFTGEVKNLKTEFVYNFDNNSLADFTIVDNDEYKDFTWAIEEGEKGYQLVSYSYYGWFAEDNSLAWINKADERLITNNAYPISAKSVLSFDMNVNGAFEEIIIEVTKDGESFTEIERITETSYSYDWLAKSVNVGEKFAELGLEYGDYQIVLYHKIDGYGELNIDNLVLTERETIYPEGRYYLFAAAEKDLSVNIAIEAVTLVDPEEPFYPTTTNHWVPDGSLFANNMSVIGLIQINGVNQNSTSLEIGAFCGEEVRGSQIIQYIPVLDKYLVFLTIHGEGSDEISFKLYDHSIGEELDLRSPEAITFAVNGTLGSIANPYILNFSNMVEITASVNPSEAGSVFGTGIYAVNDVVTLTTAPNEGFAFKNWTVNGEVVSTDMEYSFVVTEAVELVANYNYVHTRELKSGWSWLSPFIEIEGEEGLLMLENALGEFGLQIKSQTEFVIYSDGGWYGSLMAVRSDMMYMIETSAPHTFALAGPKVNPEELPITIGTNWRWLAYPLNISLSVEDALSTIVPQTGDYVKSKDAFSQYYEGAGWLGALRTMNPGEGYMYQNVSGTTKTLVYPSAPTTRSTRENVTAENNYWIPEAGKFATNMSVIAVVENNGIEMSDYEVAAFVGDEVRGSARPIYIEALDKHMIFMTVYGNSNERIEFRYYDVNSNTVESVTSRETIIFSDNATYGSVDNAIVLTCGTTGINENDAEALNVYPNPANVNAEISLGMTYDKVEVYNAIGVKVAEYADVNRIGGIETAGVYVIKVMNGDETRNCRIVVR